MLNQTSFWGIIGIISAAIIAGIFAIMDEPDIVVVPESPETIKNEDKNSSEQESIPNIIPIPTPIIPEEDHYNIEKTPTKATTIKEDKRDVFLERLRNEPDFKNEIELFLNNVYDDNKQNKEYVFNHRSTISELEKDLGLNISEIKDIVDTFNEN